MENQLIYEGLKTALIFALPCIFMSRYLLKHFNSWQTFSRMKKLLIVFLMFVIPLQIYFIFDYIFIFLKN
jgi:hypothetical protein